jgi:hypothetical protein
MRKISMKKPSLFVLGIIAFLLIPLLYINYARPAVQIPVCLLATAFFIADLHVAVFARRNWLVTAGKMMVALFMSMFIWGPLYQVLFGWTYDEALSTTCLNRVATATIVLIIVAPLVLLVLKMREKITVSQ